MTALNMKRKKVSKKNKSAWRKHTDVKDVEEFLEEQRQDERIGTFDTKGDTDLFVVDSTKDKKEILSLKKKRKLNAKKFPKHLTALENPSKITDPLKQRNHVKLKKNGRDIELEISNPTSQRHIQANKDRQKYYDKLENQKARTKKKAEKVFKNDIWEEKVGLEKHPEYHSNQWISRELALHHLKNTGKIVKKLHDTAHHKTSKLKAFEPPHPGMSYNPSLKDHQDLLQKVVENEEKIVEQEKHLKRVTVDMFRKLTPTERDFQVIKEQASGLPAAEDDDAGDKEKEVKSESEDNEYLAVNPPVENKKKDKKSRRKQKEQKELKRGLQKKKAEKRTATEIHRLKQLQGEVKENEEKINATKKRRKLLNKLKKSEPKRLSKIKFTEAEIDVNLPEEIGGNLRNVKPANSLLVDRFKNFQKRNILAASVDVGSNKRRKIKRFVRSSHRGIEKKQLM